jgi:hypothetical protein
MIILWGLLATTCNVFNLSLEILNNSFSQDLSSEHFVRALHHSQLINLDTFYSWFFGIREVMVRDKHIWEFGILSW